jgi:hypothetical protein
MSTSVRFAVVAALVIGSTQICPAPARAEAPAAPAPPPAPPVNRCACAETPARRPPVIEITFGSSQLFAHQSIAAKAGTVEESVIPVTSALVMVEWLLRPRLSVLSMFNLPLVTQKIFVNGEIREEYVAPSIALGARISAVQMEIFAATRLEVQLAALAGVTIGSQSGDVLFPLAAGRLHLSNRDGFALYFGAAYAFQKDTVAVLYGIGYRF